MPKVIGTFTFRIGCQILQWSAGDGSVGNDDDPVVQCGQDGVEDLISFTVPE